MEHMHKMKIQNHKEILTMKNKMSMKKKKTYNDLNHHITLFIIYLYALPVKLIPFQC